MRRGVRVVVGLVVTLWLAGCGSQPATPAPSATTPTLHAPTGSASALSDVVVARDKALAAYRGMWSAYQKAGEVPDPDYPDLRTYATGSALDTLTSGLSSIRDRGLVAKGEISLDPHMTGFEPADQPTSVDITDCADDSKALLYKKSGELYNDKPGGRRLVLATVKDIGGAIWKVESFGAHDVGTC